MVKDNRELRSTVKLEGNDLLTQWIDEDFPARMEQYMRKLAWEKQKGLAKL